MQRHVGSKPGPCALVRGPELRVACFYAFFLVVLVAFLLASTSARSADDYLSELDAEARKVESREIDAERGISRVVNPAQDTSVTAGTAAKSSRDAFESMLRERYLGTYGFYRKLPERSRQEIFGDYRDGAPISEVRKKIIDRLLQR